MAASGIEGPRDDFLAKAKAYEAAKTAAESHMRAWHEKVRTDMQASPVGDVDVDAMLKILLVEASDPAGTLRFHMDADLEMKVVGDEHGHAIAPDTTVYQLKLGHVSLGEPTTGEIMDIESMTAVLRKEVGSTDEMLDINDRFLKATLDAMSSAEADDMWGYDVAQPVDEAPKADIAQEEPETAKNNRPTLPPSPPALAVNDLD